MTNLKLKYEIWRGAKDMSSTERVNRPISHVGTLVRSILGEMIALLILQQC